MPTDPVQVVAEAQCVLGPELDCSTNRTRVHPECAVAALQAAGALMPLEALTWTQHAEQAVVVAQQANDVLVRVLDTAAGALRKAHDELETLRSRGFGQIKPDEMIGCLPALQKIDQSAPPATPAPSSHGGAGVGEEG